MKRLAVIVAAILIFALVVWLAGGTSPDELGPETPPLVAPSAPAPPRGFAAERPAVDEPTRTGPEQPASLAPRTLGGVVLRASDESPLDAVVIVALAADSQRGSVEIGRVTAKLGRFAFGADVAAQNPQWLVLTWTAPAPRRNPSGAASRKVEARITLAERSEPPGQLRLLLDTGWMVKGRVTGQGGKPLASVAIEREGGTGAATNAAGEFVLRDLAPEDLSVSLKFMARSYRTATLVVAPAAGGGLVSEVAVALEPAGAR
jgi:hypothetical protein